MGKKSTKENKTKYHLVREELEWSREYASEMLGSELPLLIHCIYEHFW